MSTFVIKNSRIVSRDCILDDYAAVISDGRIENLVAAGEDNLLQLAGYETVDAGGRYLVPGYIDLHMHGAMSHLADWGPDRLARLCEALPAFGVTGFLPALTPQKDPDLEAGHLKELSAASYAGTAILGFFLEGHYLAMSGSITSIPRDYSPERVRELIAALQPYRVIFGISPEVPGICGLLPIMTQYGAPAFITHTRATAQQTEEAILAGAVHATHFYDVFPYPGDKEPGVRGCGTVEAILASDRTSVDFILDGEHVEPLAVKLALKALSPDRVCLITDANVNAGMPPGIYPSMGGQEITVAYEGAPARLGPNSQCPGGLNGSGLTMDRAVRNAVSLVGLPLPQAVAMASANPARVLGLDWRKGQIKPGYDADLLLLDETLRVTDTWIAGRHVFSEQ